MLNHKSVLETLQELEILEQQFQNLQQKYKILEKIKEDFKIRYETHKKINQDLVDLMNELWTELEDRKTNDVY